MAPRFSANILVFLLIAVPLSVQFAGTNRFPEVLGEKVAYYQEHSEEFDTLLLGSSYTYAGIDPRVLDATLAAEGISASSFNLAYHGFTWHEIDAMLRLALNEDRTGHLKRVVIDMRPPYLGTNFFNRGTKLEIWWHTPEQTALVISSIWSSSMPWTHKLLSSLGHIKLFISNYLPRGAGLTLFQRLIGNAPDWGSSRFESNLPEFRGYEPLSFEELGKRFRAGHPHAQWDMLAQNARFVETEEALVAERERLIRETNQIADMTLQDTGFWRDQARRLQERNILAVYVVMPAFNNPYNLQANALERPGILNNILSFNDPGRYPELFDVENRFDFGHLNHKGATILSRQLGEELAHLIKTGNMNEAEGVDLPH